MGYLHRVVAFFLHFVVAGEVECNFDHVLINNTVITRYHNIDHGRYLDGFFGATFSYQDEANLLGLYNSSNCYQSVEQGCQPWINQQYNIERGLLDHYTNACSCLRYTKLLNAATVNDIGYIYSSNNYAFHLGFHCLQMYSFRGFPNTKG